MQNFSAGNVETDRLTVNCLPWVRSPAYFQVADVNAAQGLGARRLLWQRSRLLTHQTERMSVVFFGWIEDRSD